MTKSIRSQMALGLILASALAWSTGCQTNTGSTTTESTAPAQATGATESMQERQLREIREMVEIGQISEAEGMRRTARVLGYDESVVSTQPSTPAMPAPAMPAPAPTPAPAPVVAEAPASDVLSGPIAAQLAGLSPYQPQVVLSQRLRSIGSDTMDVVMEEWEKGFVQYHGRIRLQHEGQGSSTAIPALVEGNADFGPMSRPVKAAEVERFVERYGFEPTSLPVAIDALAVYVHPDNPILDMGLTLEQIDAIFSSTRNRGFPGDIRTWGDLGLTGEYANAPIRVYSRNSASGTYAFFKSNVLKKGDYKGTNIELPSSEAIVETIGRDPFGIGYSGIGYKTDAVETIAVAEAAGAEMIEATGENALNGTYPLARFLYLTIAHDPNSSSVNHLHREFLRYVYSPEGQRIVLENGYFPVNRVIADQALNALGY